MREKQMLAETETEAAVERDRRMKKGWGGSRRSHTRSCTRYPGGATGCSCKTAAEPGHERVVSRRDSASAQVRSATLTYCPPFSSPQQPSSTTFKVVISSLCVLCFSCCPNHHDHPLWCMSVSLCLCVCVSAWQTMGHCWVLPWTSTIFDSVGRSFLRPHTAFPPSSTLRDRDRHFLPHSHRCASSLCSHGCVVSCRRRA